MENQKISIASALKALVYLGGLVAGYFFLLGGVNARLTAIETTLAITKLNDVPVQVSEVREAQKRNTEKIDTLDKKIDALLRKVD